MGVSDTHYFVVRAAGVVRPRRRLHHLFRDRLKVHEVVACGQRWHPLDALLAVCLLGVHCLFFLLDRGHVDLAQVLGLVEVLVEGVWRVNRVEFLGRIFAGVLEDDLLASGVFCPWC